MTWFHNSTVYTFTLLFPLKHRTQYIEEYKGSFKSYWKDVIVVVIVLIKKSMKINI